jgi:TM2 domain-containing membrane protein YozV
MKLTLIITLFFFIPNLAQNSYFNFHTPENKKKFADYLFCEGDYLRAVEEYESIRDLFRNDTVDFKIMLGYSSLGLFEESNEIFEQFNYESVFYSDGYLYSLKNKLLIEQREFDYPGIPAFDQTQWKSFLKLFSISMLYSDEPFVSKEKFVSIFEEDEQYKVTLLYDYKFNPPYKSEALAGVLSAIIPGSGKMYVGEWGDGITALLVTGLFAFLAYDNFRADHNTRAWIFTGLGAFFYAGNVYGSVASAQIFNARINFEFKEGLNLFLQQKNYFMPEYDFCN